MGNGSQRASQAGTLCGEWICRQILSTAVCVSMNSVTASPSRHQLDCQANGKAPQRRPSLRSGKLTAEKKKPSETLTERFQELAVIRFNRVCACCGMLHNAYSDLCGTEIRCASRLWINAVALILNLYYLCLAVARVFCIETRELITLSISSERP